VPIVKDLVLTGSKGVSLQQPQVRESIARQISVRAGQPGIPFEPRVSTYERLTKPFPR